MARTKHRYPPLLFFSTYSRSYTLGSVPRERVSKTTLFNPISLVCFSPMHRAARHGIGRDPGRGYHGKLHVRHGKRWPPPGTVSEPFSSRWPTIRHPYLSGDFCCRCVALPVQLRSTAMRYTYMCVCTVHLLRVQSFLALKFFATIFFPNLSNQFKIPERNSFDPRNFEILIGSTRG